MKYKIYTRISERGSDWKGDTSCDAQADEVIARIRATDPKATWTVVKDELVTATNNNRPELSKILTDVQSDTADWDVLAAIDTDRLFRSQEGWLEIARILSAHNKGLYCVRQDADFRTPQGRFMLSMFAIMGEYVAKQGAQKTRDKMYFMAKQGLWPCGMVPMGYRRPSKQDNHLVIDEATAPRVREMFAMAAAGTGPIVIARHFKLPKNTVIKLLANEMYRGTMVYGDVRTPDAVPPLVDDATWQRAQPKTTAPGNKPARPTRQKFPYMLAGLVKCQCGGAMSPATCKGRHGGQWPYYRCISTQCTQPVRLIRADQLDAEVLRAVSAVAYSPAAIKTLAHDTAKRQASLAEAAGPELSRLRKGQTAAQQAVDALLKALSASGDASLHGAGKALLGELERRQSELDQFTAELKATEARAGQKRGEDQIEGWVKAWATVAADMAAGTRPDAERRAWAHAHVKSVQYDGKEWNAIYWMQEGVCLEYPNGTP